MTKADLQSTLLELEKACGVQWPTIAKAATAAPAERARLASLLSEKGLAAADTSTLVFGSLARGEWTAGSDLDWTLLVDGPVDTRHGDVARMIATAVVPKDKKPGPTGVFGGLMFSHDLVHFIGGDDDSNTNTTRRILTLLESKSLNHDVVRQRVLRVLLSRYVGEDLQYHEPASFRVPRFLLNDYVRYWRTMGVDSAQKRRDRSDKWALRNVKLRLSRKLIFVAGLWACLSCDLRPSPELHASRSRNDREGVLAEMTTFLLRFSEQAPLQTLAEAFMHYSAHDAAREAFCAYEDFLSILDDADQRKRLAELTVEAALADEIFVKGKDAATRFQNGLARLFFDADDSLKHAVQNYGVF